MKTRLVHNVATGEMDEIPVDDAWILANRKPQIEITIADTNKIVGESEAISIQLMTPELSDNSRNAVSEASTVTMQFGDVTQDVVLDSNGAWSDTLEFVEAGTYIIKCLSHHSNEITVEVT